MDQTLFENANFVRLCNRCFHSPEMLVCYIKLRKTFFYDLFSRSITWVYMGIHGDTGGFKWLQGVTGGYRGLQGLQGVTGGYKGLHEVTRDYMNLRGITETFFLARTSLDTLSSFILHKNQS